MNVATYERDVSLADGRRNLGMFVALYVAIGLVFFPVALVLVR
jgi:hypothetical protein